MIKLQNTLKAPDSIFLYPGYYNCMDDDVIIRVCYVCGRECYEDLWYTIQAVGSEEALLSNITHRYYYYCGIECMRSDYKRILELIKPG